MGDLVDLDEHRPHAVGHAKCCTCGHEWVAVVPAERPEDAPDLECPQCGHMDGVLEVAP